MKYEIVPDNFKPTHNSYSGECEIAPVGAPLEFNPYNGKWGFAK